MNPAATMAPQRPADDKALYDLLASLESAVKGGNDAGVLSPRVQPAFATDASWQPVSLVGGLWAVARTSADGSTQALCVHNLSEEAATFSARASWPGRSDSQLYFVRGSARASEAADGDIAIHVDGRSFVWLARFGPGDAGS